MAKILVPTAGPDSWRQFLAEPEKQWRTGYSAKALAHSWEEADGFPEEIKKAIQDSAIPALDGAEPLLVIPEHKVPLPGGRTESQNDVFVLAATAQNLISMCVEGKVEEPFGPLVSQWRPDSSTGKRQRFNYLLDVLELKGQDFSNIHYQLLHRTASAIIEAQRFHAPIAAMLVHSFSEKHSWFPDYSAFTALFEVQAEVGRVQFTGRRSGIDLYLGWIVGNCQYLSV